MNTKSILSTILLSALAIFVIVELLISNGVILKSLPNEIQQQTGQQAEQLTTDLKARMHLMPPTTTIKNETVNWDFTDSRGNPYHWEMPFKTYDNLVKQPLPQRYLILQLPNGTTINELDYTQFVGRSFSNVIDQVYDNAGSDDQFVYEVWYIVSGMTTYSVDITDSNLWPLEVMTRAGGDCKDLSILIADMIRSSSHTKDWKVKLVYLDIDNPTNPKTINHMIVEVDTGKVQYKIEATAKNNGLHVWDGINIFGWRYDV
jgi:hypothetical protein